MARTRGARDRAARGTRLPGLLGLLLVAACGPAAAPDADVSAPAAAPAPAPSAPAPSEDPEDPGDGARRPDPDGGDATPAPVPGPCDPETEAAVAGTVAAQLDALATGDFAAAYARASPFFRTVVDEARFTAMIRTEYPELLAVASRRLEGCNVLNRRAVLIVAITADSGARRTLAYELGESEEGWRIDGAYDVAPPEPAPASPEV